MIEMSVLKGPRTEEMVVGKQAAPNSPSTFRGCGRVALLHHDNCLLYCCGYGVPGT
jgi:hypothetical protein